jgi:hypothetical protein
MIPPFLIFRTHVSIIKAAGVAALEQLFTETSLDGYFANRIMKVSDICTEHAATCRENLV